MKRNDDDCRRRIDAALTVLPISRCRVCFVETEGTSDQCLGSRDTCSDWSHLSHPSWTEPFSDFTDDKLGSCRYQWRVECM